VVLGLILGVAFAIDHASVRASRIARALEHRKAEAGNKQQENVGAHCRAELVAGLTNANVITALNLDNGVSGFSGADFGDGEGQEVINLYKGGAAVSDATLIGKKAELKLVETRCEITAKSLWTVMAADSDNTDNAPASIDLAELADDGEATTWLASDEADKKGIFEIGVNTDGSGHVFILHKVGPNEIYIISGWVSQYNVMQFMASPRGTNTWTSATLGAQLKKLFSDTATTRTAGWKALFGLPACTEKVAEIVVRAGGTARACAEMTGQITTQLAAVQDLRNTVVAQNDDGADFKRSKGKAAYAIMTTAGLTAELAVAAPAALSEAIVQ